MEEKPETSPYFIVRPQKPIPGCLALVVPAAQIERLAEIERMRTSQRFIVRAIVSEHIPLGLTLQEVISQTSTPLLKVTGSRLTWHLHYGGNNAVLFDMYRSETGDLSHIDVEVETAYPANAFAPARTYVNEFLDIMMRIAWMPLVVIRLDLLLKGDDAALAYQCILPYSNQINFQYGGGFGHYPVFRSYEALIREAVTTSSPYYRFFCAYRLYDGVNALRKWIKETAEQFSVQTPLPRDPRIDLEMLQSMGASEEFLKGIKTTNDLFGKLTKHRNQVAHFLLGGETHPLNFSDGFSYQEYSFAAAILLHYSHAAIQDLWMYIVDNLNDYMTRGSILPTDELRDMFVIRPDSILSPQSQENSADDPEIDRPEAPEAAS